MTNTELLRAKIEESGYKILFIAEQCNITRQCLLNKINNKTCFTAPEILILKRLLKLSAGEVNKIFLCNK